MMESGRNINILIAGASGYIGRALIPKLLEKFPNSKITGLSRSQQSSSDPRVQWVSCDLFALTSLDQAVPEKVDLAIYLVHSMGPTAQLDQGTFADYDLLLADNFARVISSRGVQQVIYLGGLIPESDELSLHLESRLEVEEVFKQYQLPTTIFRAGLIIGESGSSFQILLKLVNRLPVMICPQWTQTLTTPVDLKTVVTSLIQSSLASDHITKVYDLAGCKALTYIDMMKETASALGKKRYFFKVPFFTPFLSGLWVRLITNSPKNLVYPLLDSLEHKMTARKSNVFDPSKMELGYDSVLKNTSMNVLPGSKFIRFKAQRKTVRSIQRLPLPKGKNALWVTDRYISWIPRFLSPFVKAYTQAQQLRITLLTKKCSLLSLTHHNTGSNSDRQLLYIDGGALVSKENLGRLEFRTVLNRKYALAAIHDFQPSLPWFIYKYTQAKLHLFVMKAFGRYLASEGKGEQSV